MVPPPGSGWGNAEGVTSAPSTSVSMPVRVRYIVTRWPATRIATPVTIDTVRLPGTGAKRACTSKSSVVDLAAMTSPTAWAS